jgi:hypothetical protein
MNSTTTPESRVSNAVVLIDRAAVRNTVAPRKSAYFEYFLHELSLSISLQQHTYSVDYSTMLLYLSHISYSERWLTSLSYMK